MSTFYAPCRGSPWRPKKRYRGLSSNRTGLLASRPNSRSTSRRARPLGLTTPLTLLARKYSAASTCVAADARVSNWHRAEDFGGATTSTAIRGYSLPRVNAGQLARLTLTAFVLRRRELP